MSPYDNLINYKVKCTHNHNHAQVWARVHRYSAVSTLNLTFDLTCHLGLRIWHDMPQVTRVEVMIDGHQVKGSVIIGTSYRRVDKDNFRNWRYFSIVQLRSV